MSTRVFAGQPGSHGRRITLSQDADVLHCARGIAGDVKGDARCQSGTGTTTMRGPTSRGGDRCMRSVVCTTLLPLRHRFSFDKSASVLQRFLDRNSSPNVSQLIAKLEMKRCTLAVNRPYARFESTYNILWTTNQNGVLDPQQQLAPIYVLVYSHFIYILQIIIHS